MSWGSPYVVALDRIDDARKALDDASGRENTNLEDAVDDVIAAMRQAQAALLLFARPDAPRLRVVPPAPPVHWTKPSTPRGSGDG